MSLNPMRTVLCYAGPKHGEWISITTDLDWFCVPCGRTEPDDNFGRIDYEVRSISVYTDGVKLDCILAVARDKAQRPTDEELAAFTLGHAIARLAIRPKTLRTKYGNPR